MKAKVIVGLMALSLVTLTSCDKNKGKAKDLAKQFVWAYNEGDKAGVYEMYPSLKSYDYLRMGGQLSDGLDVEKDKETGQYVITIDEQHGQRLVVEADSTGEVRIVDSYGIMKLDSACSELALKTGVPQKKLSDITQANLFTPDGLYMKYLERTPAFTGNTCMFPSYGAYSWRTGANAYVKLNFSVSNYGKATIEGKDYYLEVQMTQASTNKTLSNTKTVDGVDIAPNERREFNVNADETFKYAIKRDLRYTVEVKYRSDSKITMFLKYAKFTGNEYEEYAADPDKVDLEINGTSAVASAEKEGYVYTYAQPDAESEVRDTLYHRQPITVIWPSNNGWLKVGRYGFDQVIFLGYIKEDNVALESDLDPLYLDEYEVKPENGAKAKVYKQGNCEGDVVKEVAKGDSIKTQYDEEAGGLAVYERTEKGAIKKVGYIKYEDVLIWGM